VSSLFEEKNCGKSHIDPKVFLGTAKNYKSISSKNKEVFK
jgi:hypothetical protein